MPLSAKRAQRHFGFRLREGVMAQSLTISGILLQSLAAQSLLFIVLGGITFLLSRALKLNYIGWQFDNTRVAATAGLVSVTFGWLLISTLWLTLTLRAPGSSPPTPTTTDSSQGQVLVQALLALLLIGPALYALWEQGEPFASAGVSCRNLAAALLIGLFLALVFVFASNGLAASWKDWTSDQSWTLAKYAIVGFAEEFLFRGYLQTRLIAFLGRWRGWALTSLLMTMAHITQHATQYGMPIGDAALNSAQSLPLSLLLGYVMLCTDNIVAPALLHTFADWAGTFQ